MVTPAEQRLQNKIDSLVTPQLFDALDTLEAKVSGPYLRGLSVEERLVRTRIFEVIEQRHDLTDALDEIYADEHYSGTYTQALKQAYNASK